MTYHTGDTTPPISGVLDSGGTPVDLTGASVAVHVKPPEGPVLKLTGTGTAGGAWSAPWPGPIAETGTHSVEVEVTWADGGIQTFGPQSFYVYPQIA